ncbi:ABC transporter permease [Erysipelotrichaceae bacterium RD49]|nr:ABC transporter permease [Erysipelotrichaceae bacterium RD49]
MSFKDIFLTAFQNLKRHKSRTILTSLGVAIGCVSILILMSIGIGMEENTKKMMAGMGSLNHINVYCYNYSSNGTPNSLLNDELISQLESVEHVKAISPLGNLDNYSVSLSAKDDVYKADWTSVLGLNENYLKNSELEVIEGTLDLPASTSTRIPVLVGQRMAYNFRDTRRPEGRNRIDYYGAEGTGDAFAGGMRMDPAMNSDQVQDYIPPDPYFDPLSTELTLQITNMDPSGKETVTRIRLQPVGIVKENYQIGFQTGEGLIFRNEDLKKILQQVNRDAGKPAQKTVYTQLMVDVDSVENVSPVQDELKALINDDTVEIYSQMDSVKSVEEMYRNTQLILAGLGSISLLIAAIGITNTMVMSLTERKREIGIMKSLGCKTRDISMIFLCEAGSIGLIGGIAGVVLSILISMGINYFVWDKMGNLWDFLVWMYTPGNATSVLPPWLIGFGLLFSIAIGLVAGYLPARRSVKVSALEAMRYQ